MTDEQFKKFTNYFDLNFAQIRDDVSDIKSKIDDIYKTQDYILGKLEDIENELGFHIKQTDDTLENHEARLNQLELSPN